MFIVALDSYEEQFHMVQAELSRVVEEKKKLEEELDLLRRAQMYLGLEILSCMLLHLLHFLTC
jgi:hypothetical protein